MKTRLLRLSVRLLALFAVLLTPWAATASASRLAATTPGQARVETAVRSRPPLFIPNTGQFDPQVRYQLRGAGGTWWFTDDALWLTVVEKPSPLDPLCPSCGRGGEGLPRRGVHLKLTFPGLSPAARLVAADPQPGKTNYFLGSDATKWRSNVPTYGTLRWEELYPGVNLVFGRADSGLGLTVEATSDAALAALQLRIEGADVVRVDAEGRLMADTAIGPVALPPWLARDGTPPRPTVAGDRITLAPHPFNPFPESVDSPTSPTDDPTDLLYSTYFGGSDNEYTPVIALGPDGTIYVTGSTWSSDFPITPGAFDPTCGTDGRCNPPPGGDPQTDVFVSRLSADGSTLIYSTYLGASSQEYGEALAVDGTGAAYVTGYTISRDFPITPGAFQTVCNGGTLCADAFVTKLSADGSALVYSTFLGGSKGESGFGIALGADGSAYLTGNTASRDFPITPDAFDPTCGTDGRCNPYLGAPQYDAFVTRLNAEGSRLVYSTFLGGSSNDCLAECSIALSTDGTMHLTGNTCSSDFPTTPGAYDTSFNGTTGTCSYYDDGDVYVAALSADGSMLVYSTYLGGSDDEWSTGIAMGSDGAAYIAGVAYSDDFPTTPGAFDTTFDGPGDGFVTKLSADGSALVYCTYLGGGAGYGGDSIWGIAVGLDGAAYVAGATSASDFPVTSGAFQTTCHSCNPNYSDAFITKLSPDGSALIYSTFLGGSTDHGDGAWDITLGLDGSAYVIGITDATDFPTTPGAYDTTFNGGSDLFIAWLSPDLGTMHVASIEPFYRPQGNRYLLSARVTIQDSSNSPVGNAQVAVEITPPTGSEVLVRRTTDSNGVATFRRSVRVTGTYTFCVTGVTKYGWLYDPSQNVETCDSLTIP